MQPAQRPHASHLSESHFGPYMKQARIMPSSHLSPVWTNRTRGPSLTSLMVTSPTAATSASRPQPHHIPVQSSIQPTHHSTGYPSPVVQPAVPPFPIGPTPFLAAGATGTVTSQSDRKRPYHDRSHSDPSTSSGDNLLSMYAAGSWSSNWGQSDSARVPVLYSIRRATLVLAALSTFSGIVLSALCAVVVVMGGILVPGDVPILSAGPCMMVLLVFAGLMSAHGLVLAFGALRFSRQLAMIGLVAGVCAWGVGAWLIPVYIQDWPGRLSARVATTASGWDVATAAAVRNEFSCSDPATPRGKSIDDACLALIRTSLYSQLVALRVACWVIWAVLSLSLSFGSVWWLYSRPPRRCQSEFGYRCEPTSSS
ncbi:hypothetical protein BCR44DRAFT_1437359 [Catenaria anguillulae PL171]|uniref:Uncharacterized protein n=1 Tax=Catenaria anguillulae PL171 TaxID=765915 RepID=A0A1Y2HH84_9FUNG|nr:hypothetical protein BCR44DRAFT_1437359 [Catenaria anguillulae PL171]